MNTQGTNSQNVNQKTDVIKGVGLNGQDFIVDLTLEQLAFADELFAHKRKGWCRHLRFHFTPIDI